MAVAPNGPSAGVNRKGRVGRRTLTNSRDIANLVMQQRGLGTNNLRLRVTMGKRVCAALTSMRRRGLLVSEKKGKGLQKWRIVALLSV